MYLKRILRKPLLPLLLWAVVFIGILFPIVLSRSIEKSYRELDGLYEGMTIRCELLPQTQIGGDFSLDCATAERIAEMEEVGEVYWELECPYYLREPNPSSGNSVAYGTNDIEKFAKKHGLSCTFGKTGEIPDFSGNETICMVSRTLLEILGIQAGETITVSGSVKMEEKDETAPALILTIVGSFEAEKTDVPWNAVITPSACFFDEGELITTWEGAENWRKFTAFEFWIDSAYNKTFDTVKETLQTIIGEEWLLYSTSRELYHAVQPLEKKLELQQFLYHAVSLLFLLLPAVITAVICIRDKKEVLIRMIYGESAGKVFLSCWLSVTALLCLQILVSAGIGAVFGSVRGGYVLTMTGISAGAAAAVTGVVCRTKLVSLYQSGEE